MNPAYYLTRFLGSFDLKDIPDRAYIITACNPMDNKLSDSENQKRNADLQSMIKQLDALCLPVIGASEDFSHQEPSFLTDLTRTQVLELAIRFNQRAIFGIIMDNLIIIPCDENEQIMELGSFIERMVDRGE